MDSYENPDRLLDQYLIDVAEDEGMGTARPLAALTEDTDKKTADLFSGVIVEEEEEEKEEEEVEGE